jgi:hypothetical protein
LFPEGDDQSGAALEAPESAPRFGAQVPEVSGTEVREFVMLEMTPEVLGGVEFRSIGGKPFHLDGPLLGFDELPNESAPMSRQTVPNDEDVARDMARHTPFSSPGVTGPPRERIPPITTVE